MSFNYVTNWALRKSQDGDAKCLGLRLTLLGTDGSGETRLITAAVQKCRAIFGNRTSVVVSAHAGVDAANVRCGGRTLASLFRTVGDELPESFKGDIGIELKRELQECRLFAIGEISMVCSQKLAAISERLRQCATEEKSFGWAGAVFSGDFAHRPPIGQLSLIHKPRHGENDGGEKAPISSRLKKAQLKAVYRGK